jgi:folate-binding protein YgfZ
MELMFADRSERGKLRFTGPQRAWFLHQILTQSFEDMEPGDARAAAKLTAHGRMTGFMEFIATDEAFLCHFERGLTETLPEEITRYIFATQVMVEDVTDGFSLVLIVGDEWRGASDLLPEAIAHPTRSLGTEAGYLWVPSSGLDAALAALEASGATPASEQTLERLRVEHAVPRWGYEMDTKTFPQEAGIDAWAVHYDKGCYVGQEAMAKIHFRGKVNRRLAKLAGAHLVPGQEVIVDGAKVGTVTSASEDEALALLKYTIESGSDVTVGETPVKVVA